MKKILILIYLFSSTISIAQGEANHWFFGQNASINFNTLPPSIGTGKLNTNEGCSSFSDSSGNLLFYSDGSTIWDKNNAVMPNGSNLKGHPSSTQSAIIVPKPSDPNLYYLFTVGARIREEGEFGFYYYTIDMSKNKGNGTVVKGPINLGSTYNKDWSEKVTSVKGGDCNSVWVISLVYNTFYAYKVDASGVASSPVISPVSYNSTKVSRRGYLKVSPDGTKLAAATFQYEGETKNGRLHLYNFDNTTGIVSDDAVTLISNVSVDGEPYGLEFSPSSTFLYASTMTSSRNKLFQFNLADQNIKESKTLIHSQIGYRGALQLAPNGKIYVTVPPSYTKGTQFLNIIHNPEKKGAACNYEIDGLDLAPNYAMQGLPPFIASLLLPIEITDVTDRSVNLNNNTKGVCIGNSINITSENISGNPTYQWFFKGQPYSQGKNLSIQNISPTDAGIYELTVKTIDNCGLDKTYKGSITLDVNTPPIATHLAYDQCDFDNNPLDGKTIFNLDLKKELLSHNDTNLSVYFYKNQKDFNDDSPLTNTSSYTNTTAFSQIILTKIIDTTTGCENQGSLTLTISPTSLEKYKDVYLCENDLNAGEPVLNESKGTGFGTYDFDTKITKITALFLPVSVHVQIYESLSDAQTQTKPITGVAQIVSNTYYVRIENNITKACVAVGSFNTTLNYLPNITFVQKEKTLCLNNPSKNTESNTILLRSKYGKPADSFQWYKDGNLINNATKSYYHASEKGTYTIEKHRYNNNNPQNNLEDSYCIGYGSVIVNISSPAFIEDSNLTIVDDTSNNTLTIINPNILGIGDYEYTVDDGLLNGDYQDASEFDYLTPGFHTLYVRDKNGCGVTSKKFAILSYPKFFTPNNDGVNDDWNLVGLDYTRYKSANVQIFNRFGKLIKHINLQGTGWNGSYNGKLLKSDDYWFVVELIDLNDVSIIKKGHFSLIRG